MKNARRKLGLMLFALFAAGGAMFPGEARSDGGRGTAVPIVNGAQVIGFYCMSRSCSGGTAYCCNLQLIVNIPG